MVSEPSIRERDAFHNPSGRLDATAPSHAVHLYPARSLPAALEPAREPGQDREAAECHIGTGIGLWVSKCLVEQRGGY